MRLPQYHICAPSPSSKTLVLRLHNTPTAHSTQRHASTSHLMSTQDLSNMSATANDVSPPPYHQLEQSEAASEIFLDRIQATIEAEHTIAEEQPLETQRVRDFLLYCLAIDYRSPCPLTISAQCREHFLSMRRVLKELATMRGKTHNLKADDRRKLAPYLWKYLHAPCASLGIPVESAVIVINRYAKFVNMLGHYKGCVHGVLHTFGPGRLADKLSMDRSILVPCLVTSEQMRLELTKRIDELSLIHI